MRLNYIDDITDYEFTVGFDKETSLEKAANFLSNLYVKYTGVKAKLKDGPLYNEEGYPYYISSAFSDALKIISTIKEGNSNKFIVGLLQTASGFGLKEFRNHLGDLVEEQLKKSKEEMSE